jgi:Protein-L-isoaspartate(D-aspartate) O-methyltransferase (PCMT)
VSEPRELRERLVTELRAADALHDDRVAAALADVPRHKFLPGIDPSRAYADDAVVTKVDADGRPISSSSQPAIMALMLEQAGDHLDSVSVLSCGFMRLRGAFAGPETTVPLGSRTGMLAESDPRPAGAEDLESLLAAPGCALRSRSARARSEAKARSSPPGWPATSAAGTPPGVLRRPACGSAPTRPGPGARRAAGCRDRQAAHPAGAGLAGCRAQPGLTPRAGRAGGRPRASTARTSPSTSSGTCPPAVQSAQRMPMKLPMPAYT